MNLMLNVVLLAQDQPRETGPDFGKASPLGLLVVVLLLIGTFLLVRSMNRHLRKVPKSFEAPSAEADSTVEPPIESKAPSESDAPPDEPKREPGG
ncbi:MULTISPECIES: hypothetical protein [unclassified Mycobacterium]|uniref:hypothetical protein n=1 Tax=unclassified Mycobacterium TaxID=2642494 RepID=UPI0007405410|nr:MULTISPECIES: hypothetical protein [unclassified Mycobacterium]KUH86269.1 hypothetical protein AU187_05645 [Mycobacterium sp. IS-1556]KUH86788.1 hypothetical protein AU185_19610 [Mycobacterium sp. GA-0227b]KUH92067.1 hypothetical protein AU186_06325 [Mycobacterium sp. GA-1999]